MLSKFRIRYLVGALLICYQVVIDFFRENLIEWYYRISDKVGLTFSFETYEGPLIWIGVLITQRAIIHTFVIYCFTGNKSFTHIYGIIEGILLFGLILLFALKMIMGKWVLFSFDFFNTFLDLLKSPLLLIIFLPSYFLLKQENGVFNQPK